MHSACAGIAFASTVGTHSLEIGEDSHGVRNPVTKLIKEAKQQSPEPTKPPDDFFTPLSLVVRPEEDLWTSRKFFRQQEERHTFGRAPKSLGFQRSAFKKNLPRRLSY